MNRSTITLSAAALAAGWIAAQWIPAAGATETARLPATQVAQIGGQIAQTADPPPIYIPPRRGAPRDVAPGATRGLTPRVKLLVPGHTALTIAEAPTLYMYVGEAMKLQVLLTRADDLAGQALATGQIEVKQIPGITPIRLAALGAKLVPGVEYRVTVMAFDLAGRPKANESVIMERVAEPPELAAMIAGADPQERARTYASAGVWFDALDALGAAVDANPKAPGPHESRAALLDQAGLPEIARFDRKLAHGE